VATGGVALGSMNWLYDGSLVGQSAMLGGSDNVLDGRDTRLQRTRRDAGRPSFGRPASSVGYGWLARIECTSAPSLTVEVKKLITSLPAIVSRPM